MRELLIAARLTPATYLRAREVGRSAQLTTAVRKRTLIALLTAPCPVEAAAPCLGVETHQCLRWLHRDDTGLEGASCKRYLVIAALRLSMVRFDSFVLISR